jgi:hypothetical protein
MDKGKDEHNKKDNKQIDQENTKEMEGDFRER